MQNLVLIVTILVLGACTGTPKPGPLNPEEDVILLIVENTTPVPLGVFLPEEKSHTRLGHVDANSVARLRVRTVLLGNRRRFRVYAFRGPEACPVARMIDLTVSRTPRMIVTAADSVAGDYLPGDACRIRKN